jgi:hypothetical protein
MLSPTPHEEVTRHDTSADLVSGAGTDRTRRVLLKQVAALYALGLVGVAGLGFTLLVQLKTVPVPIPGDLPVPVFVTLTLVQPAVLLLVAVAVGALLAPRLGLRSHVARRAVGGPSVLAELRPEAPRAAVAGLALGLAITLIDLLTARSIGLPLPIPTEGSRFLPFVLASLPMRFLYGGIAEELLLRWGFLTLVAWALWAVARRVRGTDSGADDDAVSDGVMRAAILIAAVAFGVGHLPAMAASVPLTPAIVARTVLLNALGGIAYGWLYWRDSLEAAMVAHAFSHVGLVIVNVALLLG